MKKYISLFFSLLIVLSGKAVNMDNLQVSLLTVLPRSNQVYTVYGHSALRLSSPGEGLDEVYNWGTFDFDDSPFFIYRFIKGETDYFLSSTSFSSFIAYYTYVNSTVKEQILNLTNEEKRELVKLIATNQLPENIIYRYNFLFDNCTTRIRDIIEESTNNSLTYPRQEKQVTSRELIHSCTNPYPWMTFGIDLIIGSGADSLISMREEMFLPVNLMNVLDESYIIEEGEVNRPIVSSNLTVFQAIPRPHSSSFFDSPLYIGILIFFIYLGLAFWGVIKKRQLRGAFSILFLLAGVAGCIVGFLLVGSTHPCVSPNWNILWLHPFHFIGFIGYFFRKSYPLISLYHIVNLLLLCFLLISWQWLPQTLNTANIPYMLCMAMASGLWLFSTKRKK